MEWTDIRITVPQKDAETAEAIATQDAAQIVMTYDGKKVRNGGTLTLADTKDLVVTVTNGLGKQTYTVSITKTGA